MPLNKETKPNLDEVMLTTESDNNIIYNVQYMLEFVRNAR